MQDDLIGTGAGAGNADNLSAQDVYILWITDNKNNAHYFRCVTVTDRSNANAPFTFRIAHELKAPPADMSNTFQGMRCSGKNWSHRIRLNANSPVFDALSMVDLDNQ